MARAADLAGETIEFLFVVGRQWLMFSKSGTSRPEDESCAKPGRGQVKCEPRKARIALSADEGARAQSN